MSKLFAGYGKSEFQMCAWHEIMKSWLLGMDYIINGGSYLPLVQLAHVPTSINSTYTVNPPFIFLQFSNSRESSICVTYEPSRMWQANVDGSEVICWEGWALVFQTPARPGPGCCCILARSLISALEGTEDPFALRN